MPSSFDYLRWSAKFNELFAEETNSRRKYDSLSMDLRTQGFHEEADAFDSLARDEGRHSRWLEEMAKSLEHAGRQKGESEQIARWRKKLEGWRGAR